MASAATNSTPSRCGHTCTLSCGTALTSWIEPDLTTVSRRWVCPPGPAASGGPAAAAAAGAGAVATAVAVPPPPPGVARRLRGLGGLRPLEQVRGDAAGGLARRRVGRAAGLGGRGGVSAPPALAAAAFLRAASARLRRCSGISVMSVPSVPRPQSGPEMPPSLRTRQKWMARKMTVTNGSNSTWSTYQRNSVSVPISSPPSSTKRTWSPNTGV